MDPQDKKGNEMEELARIQAIHEIERAKAEAEIAQLKAEAEIAKQKAAAQREAENREENRKGWCMDCVHYSDEGAGFLDRHYCTLHSSINKTFYVSSGGTCDSFRANATRKSTGYKGGCFLTSAMVDYYGKADDCEELTALRAFRDGYMNEVEGGTQLIEEYYEIAPKIVDSINSSDKKDKYYKYISEVIEKCVKLIALKENERAFTEYKFMVENLKTEFKI